MNAPTVLTTAHAHRRRCIRGRREALGPAHKGGGIQSSEALHHRAHRCAALHLHRQLLAVHGVVSYPGPEILWLAHKPKVEEADGANIRGVFVRNHFSQLLRCQSDSQQLVQAAECRRRNQVGIPGGEGFCKQVRSASAATPAHACRGPVRGARWLRGARAPKCFTFV
jgi:hypothetical protein